jgi:hypothetical protein
MGNVWFGVRLGLGKLKFLKKVCQQRPRADIHKTIITYSGSMMISRSDPVERTLESHLTKRSTLSPGYRIPT